MARDCGWTLAAESGPSDSESLWGGAFWQLFNHGGKFIDVRVGSLSGSTGLTRADNVIAVKILADCFDMY